MKPIRRRVVALSAVVGAIGLGGVGALVIGDDETVAPPVVQVDGLPTGDATGASLLAWAEQTLAGRCMVKQGYRFWVYWKAPPGAGEPQPVRYGLDDPRRAARVGLGLRPVDTLPDASRPNANREYAMTLPAAEVAGYSQAFHGDPGDVVVVDLPGARAAVPRSGCLSLARRQLYGDLAQWLRLDMLWTNVDVEVSERVRASDEYLDALGAWSGCMRARGWDVQDPEELRERISEEYRGQRRGDARGREIAAAVAEAECSIHTGLTATGERLHAEWRARISTERAIDRDAWADVLSAAEVRARALLAEVAATVRAAPE